MKGILGFENLKINCIVGIYPEERSARQDIFVDLKVQYDLTACFISRSIQDTVDYVKLAQICVLSAEKKHELLEIFAKEVLETIFSEFQVSWAWIKIKKPQAIKEAQHAFIELEKGLIKV